MRKRLARPGAAVVAAAACVLLANVAGASPRSKAFVPTTSSIVQAMAGALGGSTRIAKIDTLYFQWHVLGVQIRNGSQQMVGGVETHQYAREWMTAAGNDRLEVLTSGMEGAPILRVFTPGGSSESITIAITNSNRYVSASNTPKCSSRTTGALCVTPAELFFDKVSPGGSHPSARIEVSEAGYSGSIAESDTCAGIASVTVTGNGNAPALYSVTPRHIGTCTISFGSSSPQGWVLEGDQGWPSGDSTGAMQGPDLSREISYVYWMTFAYLHAGGLPGTVRYVPIRGSDEYELSMLPQGGEPIVVYVNEKTFLPDKLQIGSDPFKMVVIPSAWKPTDGVLFPMQTTVQLFDEEMQMNYTLVSLQVNEKFKASLFAQPVPAL
ncbi:MAG: hypothetical protein ACP5O6_09235 [Candidatus Baltobacteraceae bacterium]